MLWGMNFYFQLLCVHVLTSWAQKLGVGGAAPPHDTAPRCLVPLDAS